MALPAAGTIDTAAEQYAAAHRAMGLPSYSEFLEDEARWHHGWELLNENGYGHTHWLGTEVITALAELRALWGAYQDPRPALDRRMSEIRFSGRVHRAQHFPRPVLPQDLQDKRDVAAVLAATTGKLAATPENIHAAAQQAQLHRPLAEELADIPVTKTNEEIMESIALAESKQSVAQLDELMEDVLDGVVNFDERKNKYNVVELIRVDDRPCWLRRVTQGPMHDIYLERDGLAQGVIVCTQAPTGTWVPTVSRDEICAWLKRRPGKSAAEAAPESGSTRKALRDMVEHAPAVEEIGEYAPYRGTTGVSNSAESGRTKSAEVV